jgi:(p)ppGpp synthase/HD superfamily hydrolase
VKIIQDMALVGKAMGYAAKAHDGQRRKYTNDPYIVHPFSVYHQLHMRMGNIVSTSGLCAALLHDVVEDCGVTRQQIGEAFGGSVERMVEALTNRYTPDAMKANRGVRRAAYVKSLWVQLETMDQDMRNEVRMIKVLDIQDNAVSIRAHDPKFYKLFYRESVELFAVLYPVGDPCERATLTLPEPED